VCVPTRRRSGLASVGQRRARHRSPGPSPPHPCVHSSHIILVTARPRLPKARPEKQLRARRALSLSLSGTEERSPGREGQGRALHDKQQAGGIEEVKKSPASFRFRLVRLMDDGLVPCSMICTWSSPCMPTDGTRQMGTIAKQNVMIHHLLARRRTPMFLRIYRNLPNSIIGNKFHTGSKYTASRQRAWHNL
jgi:hypothetical protein